MTKSASDKAGLPAWFLIVGVGGLAGIVLGAVLFFGGGNPPAPSMGSDAVAKKPSVIAPTNPTTNATGAKGSPAPLMNLPTTFEGWKTEIARAKLDSYPALMDGALRVTDPDLRARVVESLLVTWLNADRETYLQYLDQVESGDDEGKSVWPILVPAFVKAVPQLGESAASSTDLEETVQWMTDYYAQQDAPAALGWAKKWLLGEAQESAMATIAGQLSKTSLEQAVAVASGIKSDTSRADAMANIGSELGKIDPAKALAWAQSLSDPDEKSSAVEEVMWSMSESDPVGAAQQLRQINNPELLENIGGSIAESLAEKNPNQAVQWSEAIPAGAARDEAVSGALSGWAKQDPKAAFDYLQAKHATNYAAAEGLFEQWATDSSADAAARARQISDPALREHAVVGAVNGWLNGGDAEAVEQWVDQLPAGRERDAASGAVVDALSTDEPQSAWDRAVTIKDPQVRQEAVLSAFSGLAQSDATAARTALNSQTLTNDERKLLAPVLESMPKSSRN